MLNNFLQNGFIVLCILVGCLIFVKILLLLLRNEVDRVCQEEETSESRKVSYFMNIWDKEQNKYTEVHGEGYFAGYGLNYMEGERDLAPYSIAIIELKNGSVVNPPIENITFLNRKKTEDKKC